MGRREVEFLRERAYAFLAAAEDDLRAGRYDLAAFHSEQAVQLALKYLLAREAGHYPRTHSLGELFREAARLRPRLLQLYERERYRFEVMEDAYIGGRYLPRRYSRETAAGLVELARRAVEEICG